MSPLLVIVPLFSYLQLSITNKCLTSIGYLTGAVGVDIEIKIYTLRANLVISNHVEIVGD